MVEGIHAVVSVEAKLVGISVPTLPDAGCALSYRIQPGSIISRLKQLVSSVVQTIIGKCIQQVSGCIKSSSVREDGFCSYSTGYV